MAAPTLNFAVLSSARDRLVLFFSEALTGSTAPVLTLSGGATTATYEQGSGTKYLVFTLSRTVGGAETGTLAISSADYASVSTSDGFANVSGFTISQTFDVGSAGGGFGSGSFELFSELFGELFSEVFDSSGSGGGVITQKPFAVINPVASFVDGSDSGQVETTDGIWVNPQDSLTYQWERTDVGPRNTSLPVVSGMTGSDEFGQVAETGDVLSATLGIWNSALSMNFHYQWYRDGERIRGENGSTYTMTAADVNSRITAEVTSYTAEAESYAVSEEVRGSGVWGGDTPPIPDYAVANLDGNFIINRDGSYIVADPTPRTV